MRNAQEHADRACRHISREVRHSTYSTIGDLDAPPDAARAASLEEAVSISLRQRSATC